MGLRCAVEACPEAVRLRLELRPEAAEPAVLRVRPPLPHDLGNDAADRRVLWGVGGIFKRGWSGVSVHGAHPPALLRYPAGPRREGRRCPVAAGEGRPRPIGWRARTPPAACGAGVTGPGSAGRSRGQASSRSTFLPAAVAVAAGVAR